MNDDAIFVPSRFESIIDEDYTSLLIKPKNDVKSFLAIAEKMKTQKGGVLAILKGTTGIGKTTLIHSLPYYEPKIFEKIIRVPEDSTFKSALEWIKSEVGEKSNKIKIVSMDGREITEDDNGLTNLVTNLNQLLRKRKDILVCWPVNDESWYEKLISIGRKVGGKNFIPIQAEVIIEGPKQKKWKDALERLLIWEDKTFNELNIDEKFIEKIIRSNNTIGGFLEEVGDVVANRIVAIRKENKIPEVLFVISSEKEVEPEANRLRRAGNYIIKAEELTSYSGRSEPGKFWKARGEKSAKENLGYIITLFNAKLLTVKSTAVNYSCKFRGNDVLEALTKKSGMKMSNPNGIKAIKSTDLYKYIDQDIPCELTSTTKGKLSEETLKLYAKIQGKSITMHKELNKAICGYFEDVIDDSDKFKVKKYEYDAGNGNMQVDVIVEINGEIQYLEFHHLSGSHCKASKMAKYILAKLRVYAQHYELVER